jgi:hypothetical protein
MNDLTVGFPTSKSQRSEQSQADHPINATSALTTHAGALADHLAKTDSLGRMTGCVRRAGELTTFERDRMYAVLSKYFDSVSRAQFEADLAEKEWVIILTDTSGGEIQGFSTLMRLHVVVDGHPVTAFFSGDTIIHREYWGEAVLPRIWGKHVFRLAATIQDARVFWYLISSGYKTYRFLPLFFREFYPTYKQPTPPEFKRVLDALGRTKFPSEYDEDRGIVRPAEAAPLKPGVAEITERHLQNPHIAFFVSANPGHVHGHELACLAELTPANLTSAGLRMLELPADIAR